MKNIRSILLANRSFFYLFILFLAIGLLLLSLESKSASFFQLNSIHTSYLDTIFINYTFLGDGIFSIVAIVILLLIRKPILAFQALIAFLASGLFAQILKYIFHMPRPKAFFEPGQYSYFFASTHSGLNSFPSGHTTSAFALATILALNSNNKYWGCFCLCAAAFVGYSRIYLGQHFLQDVIVGSLVGLLTALMVYYFFDLRKPEEEKIRAYINK